MRPHRAVEAKRSDNFSFEAREGQKISKRSRSVQKDAKRGRGWMGRSPRISFLPYRKNTLAWGYEREVNLEEEIIDIKRNETRTRR